MAPQVNGDTPSSAFFSHLASFPFISDSISTIKSNPYGAKSLDIGTNITHTLNAKLSPILSTPISYATPYLKKADSIGDSTLSTIESKFPAVKKANRRAIQRREELCSVPAHKRHRGKGLCTEHFQRRSKEERRSRIGWVWQSCNQYVL